jgi:hypothetical protein
VVRHGSRRIPVRWEERGAALACVTAEGGELVAAIAGVDEDPGAPAVPPAERPSQAVRWLARRLLGERLGSEPGELEIVRPRRGPRPGAPEVWRRGRRLDGVELSLSHHGAFVACAAVVRR